MKVHKTITLTKPLTIRYLILTCCKENVWTPNVWRTTSYRRVYQVEEASSKIHKTEKDTSYCFRRDALLNVDVWHFHHSLSSGLAPGLYLVFYGHDHFLHEFPNHRLWNAVGWDTFEWLTLYSTVVCACGAACLSYEWRCASTGRCRSLSVRCNDVCDCDDCTDEANCCKFLHPPIPIPCPQNISQLFYTITC